MPAKKTETPAKTTETIIHPATTERTTKSLYDEHENRESEQSSENWKIGLSVGVVLVVLFIAIGKVLLNVS